MTLERPCLNSDGPQVECQKTIGRRLRGKLEFFFKLAIRSSESGRESRLAQVRWIGIFTSVGRNFPTASRTQGLH